MSSSACWYVNGSIGCFLSLVVPSVQTCHTVSLTDRRASHCLMFLGPGPEKQSDVASEPSHWPGRRRSVLTRDMEERLLWQFTNVQSTRQSVHTGLNCFSSVRPHWTELFVFSQSTIEWTVCRQSDHTGLNCLSSVRPHWTELFVVSQTTLD